ncbi:MAG: type 1 glutamine amidotransferase, partial [Bacteroidota bacterium]|nr:type 1 glutamine amidotransferase [Bacteroidota bacterium]
LIIMGGPMSVTEEKKYPWLKAEKQFILHVIEEEKPVLGICLGAQLIANVLGAKIHIAEQKEIGWWPVEIIRDGILGQPQEITTFHWHGETFSLPENITLLAQSKAIAHQAFLFNDRIVGLQFHPEMTPQGIEQLIQNCSEDITTGTFIHTAKEMLAQTNHFEQNRTLLFYLLQNLFKNTVTH